MEESTFHSRTGNGTSHASPALVAPYRWWAQASSPSKMRFSVVTATAAYRTQPLATHLTFPYARIHIHAHIYFTQLCPQMRTSHLKLRPCRYCCLRSQQTNNLLPHTHTQYSELHQNTQRIGLLVYDWINKTFKRCTKDWCWVVKAMRCWVPTTVYPLHNPESTLHKLVGLYAQIKIYDLPTSYSHLYFSKLSLGW